MGLDIFCAVFVAVFCVLGLLSGFLSQIVRLAALLGAFVLAYSAGAHTKPLLMKWMDVDSLMGDLLSLLLGWALCYVIIILTGTLVVRLIRKSSGSIHLLDRVMGGMLGSAKGFLIVYLVVCALVLVRDPLTRVAPKGNLDLKGSRIAAFAERHNVFSKISFPDLDKLKKLSFLATGEKTQRASLQDPVIKALAQNETFQRLVNDNAFRKAVDDRQLSSVLNNPSLRAALRDPQIRKILSSLDLDRIPEPVGRQ